MPDSPLDAHVRFDTHPAHSSAVIATPTGTHRRTAQALLAARGFEPLDDAMVLARIDHEEPYWADQAAQALNAEGITTEITASLLEAITEEWTWANYPMPWCTRAEIREVSNEAQKIYDDIRHGRLVIHAHAEDGWTTVAVGTYRDSGRSVYLHGENHLRQIADTFDSPTQALTAFECAHGNALHPGPAPMTDTERQTSQARTSFGSPDTTPAPAVPPVESVPAYAADPGDHEALLEDFLTENGDWEKYRTWDDNTTIANHESLTLRALFDHDAQSRDSKWTIAAYETPVSERMWHMAITPATPAPILKTLLTALAAGDAWETALESPITDKTVAQATLPLTDAGWTCTVDGRWLRWQTQQSDVGVQFDAFAAHAPHTPLDTWTIWSGPSIDHPTWAIRASGYTPAGLLADLAEELAHGTGTRQTRSGQPRRVKHIAGSTPAAPPPPLSTRLRR
ncbi:DUF317 domain-containing protein [Streptomyces sp. DG2A-72]|uniref:DUF317 domain-containing protein n=1 Tax=Streptomyces sp. DG2A-72 TaxID=3051386 RepID=UPI00265C74B5|nr:DUF317 domain-containing protein [Streptomyces sp. DG2A-72]MDO0936398.1 DUF317 domain-containing protein [Streptomyces sp. DG2A-72]